jgi:ketosteroid isomerase-like protein
MSREHLGVVRRMLDAFESEDWGMAIQLLDPEIEWDPTEGGKYHGLDGVVSHLTERYEPWDEHRVEVEEITEMDDHVLAVLHITARGERSGMQIDQRFFHVYDVRGERITRMREFVTRDEALAAAAEGRLE